MELLLTVATDPNNSLIIASNKHRARTQIKRIDLSDSAMGERYTTITAKEADKQASAVIRGLRREKPIGKRQVKRESEELVHPNVHFRQGGGKQHKGAKQPLKGVRMKLSGKKLAVWKLGDGDGGSKGAKQNSDLLKRQRVDDIAACARRHKVELCKGRAVREEEVESEEQYESSLHNTQLQKKLDFLVDFLRATDMEGNALQPIPSQDAYDATGETAGVDENDIMGAIARMEGNIAEYKNDSGAGAYVDETDTKMKAGDNDDDHDDHDDHDHASIVSKLSFAEEQDMPTPQGSVENTPRANSVIQTPLHLSRKKLVPEEEKEREGESKGVPFYDDKKGGGDEEEHLKTQEAVHSSQAGGEAEAKASRDSRDAKEEK